MKDAAQHILQAFEEYIRETNRIRAEFRARTRAIMAESDKRKLAAVKAKIERHAR